MSANPALNTVFEREESLDLSGSFTIWRLGFVLQYTYITHMNTKNSSRVYVTPRGGRNAPVSYAITL